MEKFKEFSNYNELSLLVHKKLVEQSIISAQEKLLLNPYHNISLHGKSFSHYIITCLNSGQRFFLKISKSNDATSHCNDYLHNFLTDTGDYIYPIIIVPKFEFCGISYYVTTFIEGESLDKISKTLTDDEWKIISHNLVTRLNELSTIQAPLYSEHNEFITDECSAILKTKLLNRFQHAVFDGYSKEDLDKSIKRCYQILDKSNYTKPTLLHMDVKPANIIYNSQTKFVTLIDFELSRFGDVDYGWTQILLSGINAFGEEYKNQIISYITKGHLTLNKAITIPKFKCYLFYQTACNLIYYYDYNIKCPEEIKQLFEKLLKQLSKEYRL